MRKVLLYSGGMDSWLISRLENPDIKLFVDMGTESCRGEKTRLDKDVKIIDMHTLSQFERSDTDFILPMRNMYLIALASNFGEHIILGATSTDVVHDKTQEFADKMEDLLNYMWMPQKWTQGKQIKVDFKYKSYTRNQLFMEYLDNGGTWQEAYHNSFSCYTPKGVNECHNCRPCFLKLMTFIDAGILLPKNILQSYLPYLYRKLSEYQDVWGDRLYAREDYEKVIRMAQG